MHSQQPSIPNDQPSSLTIDWRDSWPADAEWILIIDGMTREEFAERFRGRESMSLSAAGAELSRAGYRVQYIERGMIG